MRHFALLAFLATTPAAAQICRTCPPRVVRQVEVQVPVVAQAVPNIFVINAPPQIPQGSTQYSTSVYPQIQLPDVNRLISQAFALRDANVRSQQQLDRAILDTAAEVARIYQPVAEQLARGQAAAEVLRSTGERSGLSGVGPGGGDRGISASLAQQFCAECHTGAEAKAGFRLDQDFDPVKSLLQVANKKMPPDGMPDDKRLALISELVKATQNSE